MIVALGGLTAIPAELYEAAELDGATGWQKFTKITLPSLTPVLVPAGAARDHLDVQQHARGLARVAGRSAG